MRALRLQTFLLTAAGAAALSTSAFAAPLDSSDVIQTQDEPTEIADVVVRALPLGRAGDDVGSHVALLSGDELVHRRQSTLGDTLSGIPGVNSDTFGGGASRPVVRGQAAPRVKVLSEGAGLMDASEVSPDHAISGEPLLLEGIVSCVVRPRYSMAAAPSAGRSTCWTRRSRPAFRPMAARP